MKLHLWLVLLLFPLFAYAEPPVALGRYVFSGQIVPRVKLDVQVVHPRTDAERARLAKLRAANYECWWVADQTVRCSYLQALAQVEPRDARMLTKKYGSLVFDFGTKAVKPALTSKGEILSEWDVAAPVHVGSKTYPGYHLIDYANSGSAMVKMNIARDWYFYFNVPETNLRMVIDVPHTLKTGFEVNTYNLIFTNNR